MITLETDPSAGVELWVKRDDYTGAELSGNKIRKLEYVLAEARAQGADTGIYRVQILCSNPNGCAGVSGKLHLKAFDRRRTLPFTLTESRGQNLAVLKVKRQIYRY